MKKQVAFLVFMSLLFPFIGCKKSINTPDSDPQSDNRTVYLQDEFENKLRDSVWYYYRILSLWENFIPPGRVNINKIDEEGYLRDNYTKYFKTGEDVLDHLMGLTKPSNSVGKNYDWYSFLDREGVVSGEIGGGIAKSFGMYVFYLQTTESGNNADLYIQMVDYGSPAYNAGMRRGDRIMSINGNTKIDYNSQKSLEFSTINNYLRSGNIKVRFVNPSGVIMEKEIARVEYDFDPVIDSRVVDYAGKKVGYLAFSSFVSVYDNVDTNNDGETDVRIPTAMHERFENIFSDFERKGVNELVVDLRNNGGGAVITAEYLADRIVPASADKQLMYKYDVNWILKNWGWLEEGDEFGPVYFARKGSLNLTRVYFLVTGSTASASELLINSLRPYMQVSMIGTYSVDENRKTVANNTYGKPVGFFGLPVMKENKNIELYVSSFKTANKNGQGDYFNGLVPSAHVWEFEAGKFKDFGDVNESMLASALKHIGTGSFTTGLSLMSSNKLNIINRPKASAILGDNVHRNGMYKFKDIKSKR